MPFPLFNNQLHDLKLNTDEIHICFASLDQKVSHLQILSETLSLDERMRAERFHFEKHRNLYIVGRGILRMILGCYLSVEPSRLQFCYGRNGKPKLADSFGNRTIHFNLSHSEGLAIYAFNQNHKIGVDVERIRDIPEMDQMAKHFFSTKENDVLRSLPENSKKKAFFNCWTRKEAFIKATGDGLSWPLDKFDVSLAPGEPARLFAIEGDAEEAFRWSIQDLKPPSGFAAAFAVKRKSWQLRCWQWPDELVHSRQSTVHRKQPMVNRPTA